MLETECEFIPIKTKKSIKNQKPFTYCHVLTLRCRFCDYNSLFLNVEKAFFFSLCLLVFTVKSLDIQNCARLFFHGGIINAELNIIAANTRTHKIM